VNADRPAQLRAVVDHDLCAGVGQCVQIAPGAFRIGDDGLAVAVEPGQSSALGAPSAPSALSAFSAEEITEAADSCPMAAIAIVPADVSR
jgi:ferredoxin